MGWLYAIYRSGLAIGVLVRLRNLLVLWRVTKTIVIFMLLKILKLQIYLFHFFDFSINLSLLLD